MPGLTAKDVLSAFMPKTQRVLPKGTVCEVKIVRAKLTNRQDRSPFITLHLIAADDPSVRPFVYWLSIPDRRNHYFERNMETMRAFLRAVGIENERSVGQIIAHIVDKTVTARLGIRSNSGAYSELNSIASWIVT